MQERLQINREYNIFASEENEQKGTSQTKKLYNATAITFKVTVIYYVILNICASLFYYIYVQQKMWV